MRTHTEAIVNVHGHSVAELGVGWMGFDVDTNIIEGRFVAKGQHDFVEVVIEDVVGLFEAVHRLQDFNPFASEVVGKVRLDLDEYLTGEVGLVEVALEEGTTDVEVIDVEMVVMLHGIGEVSSNHAVLVGVVSSGGISRDIRVRRLVVAKRNQAGGAFGEGTS